MPKIADPTELIAGGPNTSIEELKAAPLGGVSDTMPVNLGSPTGETTDPDNEKIDLKKFDVNYDPSKVAKLPDDIKAEEERAKKEAAVEEEEPEVKEVADKLPPTARAAVDDNVSQQGEDKEWTGFRSKMAKEAGQWVESRLKENKTLKEENKKLKEQTERGNIPEAWYEHPEAVTLLPEYKQGVGLLSHLENIKEHYQKQLANIREGDEWVDLKQDAQGNIFLGDSKKPSREAETMVEGRLANARLAINNQTQSVQELVAAYQARVKEHGAGMQKLEDYYFPQYADVEKLTKEPHYQSIEKVLNADGFGNDRLSGMLKKLYVYTMTVQNELAILKKGSDKTKTLTDMQRKAGPTGSMVNNGSSNVGAASPDDAPFDMKAFEKVRDR